MFKDKKFVRRLALVLCLSLIVGLLPVSIWSAPVKVNAVPEDAANILANGNFDNGLEGWTPTGDIQIADTDAVDGNYAVIPAGEGSYFMKSDKIAAAGGEVYHLTAMVKRLSGDKEVYIGIWYVDANGAYVGDGATAVRIAADEWTEASVDLTVPAGVASIWVEFGVNSKKNSSFAVDSIVLTKEGGAAAPEASEPATEPAGNKVVFEDNIEASNFKQTWALTKTAMPWSDAGYKYEGARVLLIQGANDTATSPAFAVVAGNTYTLTYYAKQHTAPAGAADAGTAQIRFLDASGAVIDSAVAPACAVTDWTEKTITAVAPAGAVNAQLFFDSGDSKLIYVVDAIVVTETGAAAPEVTEPSTEATEPSTEATVPENLVFADDFEEHDLYDFTNSNGTPGKNPIPKDWTTYAPNNIRVACNKKYFDAYEGYNLFFQEKKDDKWAKSPAFDVVAGNTYSVEFMEIKMPGTVGTGAYVKIIFLDAAGNVVSSETKATGASATWSADSLSVVAPAGAVAAQVEFGLASATGNPEFAVDNLRVYVEGEDAPETSEPATEPSTEATEPTIAPQLGTVINGGFEDGVKYWNNTNSLTIDTNSKVTGNASVIFNDPDNRAYFVTQKVPVEAGKTYVLSAWVKIVSGKGGYIGMYDLGDANVATAFGSDKTWTYVTCEVTVPAGYSELTVEFGSHSGTIVTFMIDDIQLIDKDDIDPDATQPTAPSEPVTEPTKPADGSIFSDTFESYYTPDGAAKTVHIPDGWTASQHSAAIGSAGYDKYDGTENLCVQDPKDKWIKSPLIEVIAGYEYTANYVEKKYQPEVAGNGGYVKIVFVDASGNILKEYSQVAGTSAAWTDKVLLSKAPAGATHMYVEFGLASPSGEPTYSIDNLKVFATEASLSDPEPTRPTEPIPTEPEGTNVMLGDSFETLLDETTGNAGPLGWTSSDDINGAYSTAISVGQYMNSDGNCLCLQTPGQWSIRSDKFAARAGYEYTVKFLAQKVYDNTNFAGTVTIVFLDAWGTKLDSVTETVGKTFGEWAEESVTALAPVDTVAAYIEFALDNADRKTKGDYAVDSLEVVKSDEPVFVPDATEPSTPDDGGNSGTGDNTAIVTVSVVMVMVVAMAVLVIKKRRFF